MTSVSCFSLLLSPFSFSCILLPLLACHFPPFFALILSLGSFSIPAPSVFLLPFLSFVSSISPPFFQSSLSSLLLHFTSYTFLSLTLDFLFSTLSVLCSPVACCSVTQSAPPSPWTKSTGRTNITNVIPLCVNLWHVSEYLHICTEGTWVHVCVKSRKQKQKKIYPLHINLCTSLSPLLDDLFLLIHPKPPLPPLALSPCL